jgi:lysyl-tRNA synthetase class 2
MCPVLKNKSHWAPSASLETLKKRAEVLANIRTFFAQRNVVEVETPLLCRAPVTDPFLEALSLHYQQETWYLQTSPEYAMKRLLCAGMGSIYQISKAFRAEEKGGLHNPEFTLLEWYRIDFDHHALMREMDDFLQFVIHAPPAKKITYHELFETHCHFNPHEISEKDIRVFVEKTMTLPLETHKTLDKDDYLQLLMTHVIEPQLSPEKAPVFIYDFPASQAALAKVNGKIAERFEVYIQGVELANAYYELGEAKEQLRRFEADLKKREKLHLPQVPIDAYLIGALTEGLPPCAGVALGIDRLLMVALQKSNIEEVMSFDSARA